MDAEHDTQLSIATHYGPVPRWTESETELLKVLWADLSLNTNQISTKVGRSRCACACKAQELSLPHRQSNRWLGDRAETVKQLFDRGLSASKIAAQLGRGFTRNAIIGKLYRLGLSRPKPQKTQEAKRQRANERLRSHRAAKRQYTPFNYARNGIPVERAKAAAVGFPPGPAAPSLNLSIIEVKNGQCKYMAGEDHLCCAHPVVAQGSSWCDHHRHIVFGGGG
jgi:hypothetical protein